MKNKTILKNLMLLALFLGSCFFLNGCKKLVDIDQPRNTIPASEAFSNNTEAGYTLAGMYNSMLPRSPIYSGGFTDIVAGLSADEIQCAQLAQSDPYYVFQNNTLDALIGVTDKNIWVAAYKEIDYANSIIDGVAASKSAMLTDSARKQLNGEAKFVRAFSYFYLVNFYGDVPMPLTSDFNKTALLGRASQVQVYQQMVTDLVYAESVLPANYAVSGNERVRPNKWAAAALLARVYLYQKDWKNAEAQAGQVIASPLYSLVTDLPHVFDNNSVESIWQLSNSSSHPYVPEISGFSPTEWLTFDPGTQDFFLNYPPAFPIWASFVFPQYALSDQLASSFEPKDQRFTTWVGKIPTPPIAPFNSVPLYYFNKYQEFIDFQSLPNGTQVGQYYTMLRLAEQYLIRAEARAEQNNLPGAAADINVIRARAGLASTTAATQANMLKAVAQERRVELFAEWGHRFFDLKRTGQAITVLGAIGYKHPFSANQLLYPIPPSELRSDPNLHQNPGY